MQTNDSPIQLGPPLAPKRHVDDPSEDPTTAVDVMTQRRISFNLPPFDPSASTSSLLDAVVGSSSPAPPTSDLRSGNPYQHQTTQSVANHPYRNSTRALPAPPSSFPAPLAAYSPNQEANVSRKPSLTTTSSSASSRSRFSRLSRSEALLAQSPNVHGQEDSDGRSKADSSEWDVLSDADTRLNEEYVGEEEAGRMQELEKKVERRRSHLPQLASQLAALEARIKEAEARLAKAQGGGASGS